MSRIAKLLIVDSDEQNRDVLRKVFKSNYEVVEASNGDNAMEIIRNDYSRLVVVLLSVDMPIMNGFDVLKKMGDEGYLKRLPVVMITPYEKDEILIRAYRFGVSNFIRRPFNSKVVKLITENAVKGRMQELHLEGIILHQTEQLRRANRSMIDTLSTIVEFRCGESSRHIKRVRYLTKLIAEKYAELNTKSELEKKDIYHIAEASALHDIGKIVVPEYVINKPAKLTPEEFEIMKRHTINGAEIISNMEIINEKRFYDYCYNIARSHHERWDGRGYPDGLAGNRIPLCAQIVSIADVYDALTSERVYKSAYGHENAMKMIIDGECGVFNPQLVSALVSLSGRLSSEMYATASDIDDFYNSETEEAYSVEDYVLTNEDIEKVKQLKI